LMVIPLVLPHLKGVESKVLERSMQYGGGEVREGSLGSALVAGQPVPVRLVVGPFYVMISPIPLWNNFRVGVRDYHWIKGYHGLFVLFIMPMVIMGAIIFFRRAIKGGAEAPVACFVVFYAIITLLAIAATSLENRHQGQFLPAMLILAAVPDKSDPVTKSGLGFITTGWLFFILAGHMFWMVLKFF